MPLISRDVEFDEESFMSDTERSQISENLHVDPWDRQGPTRKVSSAMDKNSKRNDDEVMSNDDEFHEEMKLEMEESKSDSDDLHKTLRPDRTRRAPSRLTYVNTSEDTKRKLRFRLNEDTKMILSYDELKLYMNGLGEPRIVMKLSRTQRGDAALEGNLRTS